MQAHGARKDVTLFYYELAKCKYDFFQPVVCHEAIALSAHFSVVLWGGAIEPEIIVKVA